MNFAHIFDRDDNTRTLSPGERLIEAGQSVDELYVIIEGAADIVVGGETVEKAERGSIVGELSMIDHSPACASVVASTKLKVASVDQRRFTFLIQQHPTFAIEVMKVMAARLRNMDAEKVTAH